MVVITDDEGVLRGEAVDDAEFDEEIEAAIDRDRRDAAGGRAQPLDDLVGLQRSRAAAENRQHVPT